MTEGERIARLEQQMADAREDMREIKGDLRAIRDTLAQARGGWKTLVAVAGLAGTVGAALAKVLPFLPMK